MSSIFRKDDNHVDKPNRNTFDLSFANNLSTNYGKIAPVLVQPVSPGDSFRIEPTFALRWLPQVFPVQTRQRASLKYFYVRNRNLWTDWMDFIGGTKEGLTPPYINFTPGSQSYFLSPGSLADYMGVPIFINPPAGKETIKKLGFPPYLGNDYVYIINGDTLTNIQNDFLVTSTQDQIKTIFFAPSDTSARNWLASSIYGTEDGFIMPVPKAFEVNGEFRPKYTRQGTGIFVKMLRKPFRVRFGFEFDGYTASSNPTYLIVRLTSGEDVLLRVHESAVGASVDYSKIEDDGSISTHRGIIEYIIGMIGVSDSISSNYQGQSFPSSWNAEVVLQMNQPIGWCDLDASEIPFYGFRDDGERISALPFRAYESIYNALIRNAENNPLIVNGKPEYNKYVVHDSGGASPIDLLQIRYSNWSDDRFTTALPSPQQGNAPLVGLTGVAGATVTLGNEDGSQSQVHLQVDSATGNVVMVEGASGSSNNGELTHAFLSAVDFGITINDLRNVNAFQKWLENNIRRGYKYKDQLMAHYGVSARFDTLDMPEFIGGVTRDISVNQITQTTQNEDGNLGDIAGQSSCFGEGHSIEHYCDEHGWIIGVLEVKPVPTYMDALPKYLGMQDRFEYYFPEFGKIGMQPIKNKELAFSQSVIAGKQNDTFGYQRAWYDELENLDVVRGLMRSDYRHYLLARDFWELPSLGENFLTVDPDDVNNTFYVDDFKDKILGQVYHKIIAKRPIPLYGIPSIE